MYLYMKSSTFNKLNNSSPVNKEFNQKHGGGFDNLILNFKHRFADFISDQPFSLLSMACFRDDDAQDSVSSVYQIPTFRQKLLQTVITSTLLIP